MRVSIDNLVQQIEARRRRQVAIDGEIELLQQRIARAVGKVLMDGGKPLTARQVATMDLLAMGLSNKEIAAKFNVTVRTVKFHISGLLVRFKKQTRAELGELARAGISRTK